LINGSAQGKAESIGEENLTTKYFVVRFSIQKPNRP